MTVFETFGRPDSATPDRVYARTHPRRGGTRKHLPPALLACYRCNQERAAKEATTGEACPVIKREGRDTSV